MKLRFNLGKITVLSASLGLIGLAAAAQTPVDPQPDEATEQKIEKIAEEAGEELDANTLLDKLNYYREHPINLNHTTREELKDLLLLNDIEIEAIFRHLDQYGEFIAIHELQTIDELSQETIFRILPFISVNTGTAFEKFSFGKMLEDGKNSVLFRYQQVLEKQDGYKEQSGETFDDNKSYAGSPAKLYARYRYTYGNRISLGLTGEKDAGEEFFKGSQKNGFDFYSGHVMIRGNGFIRTIALGDFQAQYGQGVVLWSGLAFGKSADVMNLKRNSRGLLPYTSTDENAFFRGGAVALGHKKFQLDLFYSSHRIDGNLVQVASPDSQTVEDIISAFQTDGYHRTKSELEDKKTVTETHAGSHLGYKSKNLTIGATALSTYYSKPRTPAPSTYNQFDFSGDQNFNAGVDFSYLYRNVSFFAEAGQSKNNAAGYLGGMLLSLDPKFALSVVHRHYDKDYQALKSNAISENSKDQNETGTLAAISARPVRAFQLNAYYDMFRFPWLKFQVDAPSAGYEYLAQLSYIPNKSFEAYFRFKQQNKQENVPGSEILISGLQEVVQTNYRFNIRYKVSRSLTLSNRVEYVTLEKESSAVESGYVLYQDIAYKPMQSRVSFSLRYVLFDTDSYDTRIYSYENDVLYAYSIPSYYYRGSRYYLLVHYSLFRGIDFWVRFGRTDYNNKHTTGSDLDTIDLPHKTEVKAQVRFQF